MEQIEKHQCSKCFLEKTKDKNPEVIHTPQKVCVSWRENSMQDLGERRMELRAEVLISKIHV